MSYNNGAFPGAVPLVAAPLPRRSSSLPAGFLWRHVDDEDALRILRA
jgi:hypothetical protein